MSEKDKGGARTFIPLDGAETPLVVTVKITT